MGAGTRDVSILRARRGHRAAIFVRQRILVRLAGRAHRFRVSWRARRELEVLSARYLCADQLVRRYKKADANAVDNNSFSMPMGSLFVLLGPNDAGESIRAGHVHGVDRRPQQQKDAKEIKESQHRQREPRVGGIIFRR